MKYISKGSLSVSLLLAILLLFGCLPTVSHAKIVFSSKQNGDTLFHIYVMEDNGSNVLRITSPDFFDLNPRWFPDGKRILFQRDLTRGSGQRDNEFYIINANGRNERNFMENHPTDFYPVPSPDGKQVVFVSRRTGTGGDIYLYLSSREGAVATTDRQPQDRWTLPQNGLVPRWPQNRLRT